MSQTTLFIAGAVVSAVVFTGLFVYLMLVFSKSAERSGFGTGDLKD
jgi:hypothetical protein